MKVARKTAIIALAFLAITAIIGAIPMLMDPSGRSMHIPLSLLAHTPFRSFLIPGILLLAANGLTSMAVLVAVLRRVTGYGWWVGFQGCVLTTWITYQVVTFRAVSILHFLYWGVGLILIAAGWTLRHQAATPVPPAPSLAPPLR